MRIIVGIFPGLNSKLLLSAIISKLPKRGDVCPVANRRCVAEIEGRNGN